MLFVKSSGMEHDTPTWSDYIGHSWQIINIIIFIIIIK